MFKDKKKERVQKEVCVQDGDMKQENALGSCK